MSLLMGKILKDLGWSDGFHIPAANEENKKLEQEVEGKLRLRARCATRLDELTERVSALAAHLRNVEQAHQQNQGLVAAQYNQLRAEEHLAKVARGERSRLDQDLRRMDQELGRLTERHQSLQKDVVRHTEKLGKLKATARWDEEARLAWDEAVARGEDDNLVLLHAIREDDDDAKARELERQRLQADVHAREQLLVELEQQVRELRCTLDRTAELLRAARAERCDLLAQWEDTVRALHRRDQDIYTTTQEMNVLREQMKEREVERDEQRQFYENEVNNNKEMDLQVSQTARTAVRLREELAALRASIDQLLSEEQAMQRSIAQAGRQLNDQLQANDQLRQDVQRKKELISQTKAAGEEQRRVLEAVTGSSSTAADRVQQLEQMVQVEERTGRVLEQDVARLQEQRLRAQAELSAVRRVGDLLHVDAKGCELAKAAAVGCARDLRREAQRHRELSYNLDYECQKLESLLARVSGSDSAEDKEVNEKKMAELEEALEVKTATLSLVKTQIARLEEMERRLVAQLGADGEELARLEGRLLELSTAQEGGQRRLRARRRAAQAHQVEENLLQLRVRQAEVAISREGDRVYSLERYRLELDTALKERQVEIEVQRDVMLAKKRGLTMERSKLVREIAEWKEKISQLRSKHELAVTSFGQGDDGKQLSVTQLMLKNAQEKYELQQEGDQLDGQIQRAEKEILALENTLKVVNTANDMYKKSLSAVDEDGSEVQRKVELEQQLAAGSEKLKHRRSQLQALRTAVADMESSLAEVGQAEQKAQEQFARKQQELCDLEAGLQEQQVKIERAGRQVRRLVQELRGRASGPPTVEEKDIETRELQEQNQTTLQHLALVATLHLETGPVIKRYLADKDLSLPVPCSEPHTTPSPQSDRSGASSAARSRTSTSMSPSVVTLDLGQLPDDSKKCVVRRSATPKKKK